MRCKLVRVVVERTPTMFVIHWTAHNTRALSLLMNMYDSCDACDESRSPRLTEWTFCMISPEHFTKHFTRVSRVWHFAGTSYSIWLCMSEIVSAFKWQGLNAAVDNTTVTIRPFISKGKMNSLASAFGKRRHQIPDNDEMGCLSFRFTATIVSPHLFL